MRLTISIVIIMSTSSGYSTTYSEDIRIEKQLLTLKRKRETAKVQHELERKEIFEKLLQDKRHKLFHLPGLEIPKLTHEKIRFAFQPSAIHENISRTYLFRGSLRYLATHKFWIVNRMPMYYEELYRKVIFNKDIIEDHIDDIYEIINKMYLFMRKWCLHEISYRKSKYEGYKVGTVSYIEMDSIDEEIHFTQSEREQLHKKKKSVLKRMLPPKGSHY